MASTFTTAKLFEKQGTGDNSGTWGTVLNAVLDDLDAATGGMLSLSVAGSSNVTLTDDQALNAIIKLTGTLTGNIEVRCPARTSNYRVWNATSGAFTLTFKTAAGTGIVVDQGTKRDVFCDATNVEGVIPETGLPLADGGTGATTAAAARTSLGINWEMLAAETLSGASSKAYTTAGWFDGTYEELLIVLEDFTVSADGANVFARVSTDGGSNWKQGASDYLQQFGTMNFGSATAYDASMDSAETQMNLASDVDSATTENNVLELRLVGNANGVRKHKFRYWCSYTKNSPNTVMFNDGMFRYATAEAINALQIAPTSGTISGRIRLYGKRAA